jgi:hypothetical protein
MAPIPPRQHVKHCSEGEKKQLNNKAYRKRKEKGKER